MSMRRDPYFGRFAVTVITAAVVICVLGLVGIYYFFEGGTSARTGSSLRGIFGQGRGLAPNQAMLYYTRDGLTLVGNVSELPRAENSLNDKASLILQSLLAGNDAGFLRTPIPRGTTLKSVFVNDNTVIVNLSKEFVENLGPSPEHELLAVYSIVNTLLTNMETADSVQILIEGERLLTIRGAVDLERPLIANAAITSPS